MALILGVRSLDCEQGDSLKEATLRPDPSCPKCSLLPKHRPRGCPALTVVCLPPPESLPGPLTLPQAEPRPPFMLPSTLQAPLPSHISRGS